VPAVALHLNRDAAIAAAGNHIHAHIARPGRDRGLIAELTHDPRHGLLEGMAAEAIEILQLPMAACLGTAAPTVAAEGRKQHQQSRQRRKAGEQGNRQAGGQCQHNNPNKNKPQEMKSRAGLATAASHGQVVCNGMARPCCSGNSHVAIGCE
jgi:hypothetical protein